MKVVLKSGGGAASFEDYIVKLPPGEKVFSEGDVGTEMYVIQSGSIEIAKRVKDEMKTLSVLEKGDFFGEMSILEDVPRTADAIARTDVELVRINQSTFDEMLRHNGEIAVRMLRKLSRRLRFQVIEEIGTMNGTFVNGKRIATGSPTSLHDGDRLRFGLVDLTFRVTRG